MVTRWFRQILRFAKSAVIKIDTGSTPDNITTVGINTMGYQDLFLNFWYEIPEKLESDDYVKVQWSSDESNWDTNTIHTYSNVEKDDWTYASFSLPSGAENKSSLKIRFLANLNISGGHKDEFRLDCVELTGVPIPPPPECTTNADCNDPLYCNGEETCVAGQCVQGTSVDCSANDISEVNECYYIPDDENYTKDFRNSFISQCDEVNDICTTGNDTITHTCSVTDCQAECDAQHPCPDTICSDQNDCVDDDYYSYTDVANSCQGDCSCTNNECGAPIISYNDPACTECQIDDDCNSLDRDYCDGTVIKHDEGVCVDYECVINTTNVNECNDGLACNGAESCSNADCVSGAPVDCSQYNLLEINICGYDPDCNPYTLDYRPAFTSECQEPEGICTTGDDTISHTCDERCDAECTSDEHCADQDPNTIDTCNSTTCKCEHQPKPEETGSIFGQKYNDLNKNGEWDDGEPVMNKWIIYLDENDNGQFDEEESSYVTDDEGWYQFNYLTFGNYKVCEVMKEGWATADSVCRDVTLNSIKGIQEDFGNYELPRTGSLTICKYEDNEPYRINGGEDTPLAWTMRVTGPDYDEDKITNSENGCVKITGLPFGSYTVSEYPESNWAQMYPLDPNTHTVMIDEQTPDHSVYFLNYNTTSQLPTMYACNPSTLQCAIDGSGPFGSLQGCLDACGATSGVGGQYMTPPGIVAGAATEKGEVAGASTTCSPYLLKYIKLGASNDPEEVKKLQSFLNDYFGLNLPVSGIYDEATFNAVKQFQLLLNDDILAPWVAVGCLPSENIATGYVYRTTTWAINNIFCPIPKPDVSDEKCFGAIFISEAEGVVSGAATSTLDETDETATTTSTTAPETIGDTTTTVPQDTGDVQPQNWIWVLIGLLVIGGAVYLVYQQRKK